MIIDTLIQKIEEKVKQIDGTYIIKHRQTSADIVLYDTKEKDETGNTIYSEVQTEIDSIKEKNIENDEIIKDIGIKQKTMSDLLHGITKVSNIVNETSTTELPTSYAVKNFFDKNFKDNLSTDMKTSVYDTNNSGTVDDSEKLGGELPEVYQKVFDESLQTNSKTVSGAINEVMDIANGKDGSKLISEENDRFNTEKAYTKNSYAIKDDKLYKFVEDKPEGEWDETKVQYTTVIKELDALNAKMQGVLLWKNPNATAIFPAQTINLLSDDYDIYSIHYVSGTDYFETGKISKNNPTLLNIASGGSAGPINNVRRATPVAGGKMDFGDAISASAGSYATTNNVCVPTKIVGYKS